MKRYVAVLVGVVAVSSFVFAQSAFTAKAPKTAICHKTHSAKTPYVKMKVGKSVLKGHIVHPGDIIPAPTGGCPTSVLTPTAGGRKLTTTLTGTAEAPGPGDPDGTGTAQLRLRVGQGQVCYVLTASNITLPALAAHIHRAPVGVAGPVVVPLTAPDAAGSAQGCATADRALVKDILKHPDMYYVNVHTTDFPAGAIRGQL